MYNFVCNTSSGLLKIILQLIKENQAFFVSQLVGRIGKLLSQETDNAGLPSNLFTASYDSDQRRMSLNITDNTYNFKIPTDNELQELAVWQDSIVEIMKEKNQPRQHGQAD